MSQAKGVGIPANELLRFMQQRRSTRRYQAQSLPDDTLRQLLQAATWAPSAHNRQPWRFAVIQRDSTKERLARDMGRRLRQDLERDGMDAALIAKDVNRSRQRITKAPALILLCLSLADMDRYPDAERARCEWTMAAQSAAMAGQNLLLMAQGLGLGACWMCAPLFCPELVRETLDLPADWQPQGMITLGYPAEERQRRRDGWEAKTLWR